MAFATRQDAAARPRAVAAVDDEELKRGLATAKPYRDWIETSRVSLEDLPEPAPAEKSAVSVLDRQQAFGYTQEDLKVILSPMVPMADRWAAMPR